MRLIDPETGRIVDTPEAGYIVASQSPSVNTIKGILGLRDLLMGKANWYLVSVDTGVIAVEHILGLERALISARARKQETITTCRDGLALNAFARGKITA